MRYSIVLIEDNPEDVAVVVNTLSGDKYSLNLFDDGAKAWAYLEQNSNSIDIVILGKTIPNISGMDILSGIKKHPVMKKIPVIIQTVDTTEGNYKTAIAQGAHFYLHKPIDSKKLATLVKASLRSARVNNNPPLANNANGSFAGILNKKK